MTKVRPESVTGKAFSLDKAFRIYDLARAGMGEKKIATALGVTAKTFAHWKGRRAVVRAALDAGRAAGAADRDPSKAFLDAAITRLPKAERAVWAEVEVLNAEEKATGRSRTAALEFLLQRNGERVRQKLFVYALMKHNFNESRAAKMLNVSPGTRARWSDDAGFQRLMGAVMAEKKDLFESSLIRLVKSGNASAVMFANRTLNRDRGYSEKTVVEHTHTHAVVDVSQLALDPGTKAKVLKAYQQAQRALALGAHEPTDEEVEEAEVLAVYRALDADDPNAGGVAGGEGGGA